MRKLKLYLETSIFNIATSDQNPEYRDATLKLFEKIKKNEYEAYTSLITIREIERAKVERARELKGVLDQLNLEILQDDPEIENLANEYVRAGLINTGYMNDARHIAMATFYELDMIVSWNFEHIVKMKMKKNVSLVNNLAGYKAIEIADPMEVD